jgi:hypothetical protein
MLKLAVQVTIKAPLLFFNKKMWKEPVAGIEGVKEKRQVKKIGGERGIRTLGALSDTHAFQACTFSLSAISPLIKFLSHAIRMRIEDSYVQSSGGEGGIRTHDSGFTEYRFSRAAPSASRPPLPHKPPLRSAPLTDKKGLSSKKNNVN